MSITIIGTGRYLPGEPVTNEALARVMDTNDAWIRQRTGIHQRHFAEPGQGSSDLALPAAQIAIEDAGLKPTDIDYILFATMTPEHFFPGSGPVLGAKLGIAGVPALDIRQQCAAIPFALQVANGLVESGAAETILIAGADTHAGFMPWRDWDIVRGKSARAPSPEAFERATRHRGLAVIFGDGAGAMVVRRAESPNTGFIGAELHSDGNALDYIYVPGVGFTEHPYISPETIEQDLHIPRLRGQELFKAAVHELGGTIRSLCEKHDIALGDIDHFIAHQANDRINQAVRKSLRAPKDKVPSNIARYANTSSGTIGILTDELRREGRLRQGDLICFFALGAGLNWGAALLRL